MLALVIDYYVPWQHKCGHNLNAPILFVRLRGKISWWTHVFLFVAAPFLIFIILPVMACLSCCKDDSGGEQVPLQAVDAHLRGASPTTRAPSSLQHAASATIVLGRSSSFANHHRSMYCLACKCLHCRILHGPPDGWFHVVPFTPRSAADPAVPTPLNQMITKPAAGVSANSGSGAVRAANHRIVGGLQPSAPPLAQSQSASQQLLRASVTGFAVLGRALAAAGASASKGAIIRDGFTDDDLPVLQRMKVEMLVAKYGMTAEQARLFRLVQLQDEALNAAAAAAAAVDAVNVPDHLTDQ